MKGGGNKRFFLGSHSVPYHELVLLVDCVPLGLKRVQELGALAVLELLQVFIAIADL